MRVGRGGGCDGCTVDDPDVEVDKRVDEDDVDAGLGRVGDWKEGPCVLRSSLQ